jgi:tRNA (guanine37-N1)-methyltransferase
VTVRDLRDFTTDRHRVVDDVPYGGGPGMVLKPDPIFRALDAIEAEHGSPAAVILTSPQGQRFTQAEARRLSRLPHIVLLCGRYEGVDERVRERVTEEVSIGDYVLSGGELAAAVVVDAVARLLPGVLGNEDSAVFESFREVEGQEAPGILDCPQYTRPAEFRGWKVPEVLLGGNHEEIRRWRKQAAREKTARLRPDLLGNVE